MGFLCLWVSKICLLTLICGHFGHLQELKTFREYLWSKIVWNGGSNSSPTCFVISSMSDEPYTDPALPPQRQEMFFPNAPNTGRLSGPAELRAYNVRPFDKTGGNYFHDTIKWGMPV